MSLAPAIVGPILPGRRHWASFTLTLGLTSHYPLHESLCFNTFIEQKRRPMTFQYLQPILSQTYIY